MFSERFALLNYALIAFGHKVFAHAVRSGKTRSNDRA